MTRERLIQEYGSTIDDLDIVIREHKDGLRRARRAGDDEGIAYESERISILNARRQVYVQVIRDLESLDC